MKMGMRRVGTAGALVLALTSGGCATLLQPGVAARPRQSLATTLDSIFADSALEHAHWGVLVKSLRTGETLYRHDAEKLFVPASNMKLATAAAALSRLGPAYRYHTTFTAGGLIQDGVVDGPLVVRGDGDPTLSSRFAPDPRSAMRAWADSLRARGVTRVAGGIIGVDSAFSGPSLGAGWAWDDLAEGYAAEFGALQFNEGIVEVQVIPSRTPGTPGIVVLNPPTQYVRVNNLTVTTAAGTPARIELAREPAGSGIVARGEIPVDTPFVSDVVAVRDPTAFYLSMLRETLRQQGIAIEGQALPADRWPVPRSNFEVRLFEYWSPPLSEILPAFLKPSQNLIAETLLHSLGWALRRDGSAQLGISVIDSVFQIWNLPVDELRMADGSGLSRYDLASPAFFVALLMHMRQGPHGDAWYASLPVAGVDGTLAHRMREAPLLGNVHAKTGSLTGVRCLSGYLTTTRGEPIVFSILVNDHLGPAAEVDRVAESALRAIATSR